MTAEVIDLSAVRVSRGSCYRQVKDLTAPHQLQLHFVNNKTQVQGVCNCGARFTPRAPEVAGTLAATVAEYDAHVDSLFR